MKFDTSHIHTQFRSLAYIKPPVYRILKFFVVSFGLDAILLTDGSVLDSSFETWG